MMVMMTRQLPATNKQAWWIASIARMYCAFILHSWRFSAGALAPTSLGRFFSASLLHVLDALDQRGVLRRMLVPDRLDRVLEWLEVGNLVDLGTDFLHVLDRLLLHLVPELALLELRRLGRFHDQVLIAFLQRCPRPLRKHQG